MNITAPIHMHARLRPQAPAVMAPARSLNFAQLDAATWRAAAHFRAQGLETGQVVVLDVENSVKHLVAALGLARIGVAHLAKLPRHDASDMAPLMTRIKAARTISEADAPDDSLFGALELQRADIDAIAAGMEKHAAVPWYYVTSSGTTGRPKIVPFTHRMTFQRCRRFAAGVPMLMTDRYMPFSDLAFHVSKGRCANTLIIGGCVVFADGLTIDQALVLIRERQVTRISCAAIHLHRLCALEEGRARLPELRVLDVVGSEVPESLRRAVREKVTRNLYVTYGATESGALTVAPPEASIPGTVGIPLPGVHIQVVDDVDWPLPRGEVGTIRIRAEGTITEYPDDPEATAKAFRGGWFYPGDFGALTDDDQLIHKGRTDDMMIYDGINVYPMEVEAVLATHAAVGEAAAFGLKSQVHQDVPVAAVTLREPVAEAELLAFCRARLGQRAPQRVYVVKEFPRNPAGKILKRELPALLAAQPAPRSG